MDPFGDGIYLKTDAIHLSWLLGKEYEGFSLKGSKHIWLWFQSLLSYFEFVYQKHVAQAARNPETFANEWNGIIFLWW